MLGFDSESDAEAWISEDKRLNPVLGETHAHGSAD